MLALHRPIIAVAAGIVAVAATGVLGVACSTSQAPPAAQPQGCTLQVTGITVISSPKINPDDDGSPRPVQLRIYQLKTDTRLLNASFDQIWKDDKATLQDDLVKVDELPVYPDTRTELKFERDPSALFVAAVALFRNPKGRSWWTEFELPPPPGKGNCVFSNPKCSGPACAQEAGPPPLAPHFAIWIDGSRIDDGSDHLDDQPSATRVREVYLHFSPPSGQPAAPAPVAPAAPAAGSSAGATQ
jgi:type VI secretion system protein VasD